MHTFRRFSVLLTVAYAVCLDNYAPAAEPAKRPPWTTSNFRGRPEPPLPFVAERIFPKLKFKAPTALTSAPGTRRMFVVEQKGKIYSIPHEADPRQADLLIDVNELVARQAKRDGKEYRLDSAYGLTFHPDFIKNRLCYVCYVLEPKQGGPHPQGTRVVRLQVSETDPPRCDPASETTLLTWLGGGHNGGCLKFGPDGMLYISTGDAGNAFPPDGHNTGQDISDLLASILRIDVDRVDVGGAGGDRQYSIPKDNPFVDTPKARGEVWAYGLRNPWKMSFDRKRGELWVGDVGWELWELVFRVNKGDNYGWSLVEGRQPVHADRPRGPTPIVPPTVEIPHHEGASVTGGYVYRGKKFPELVGQYLFGDWETRRVWGVNVDEKQLGPKRDWVEPTVRVVDFAEDHDGEIYLLDYDDGTIHALARNPAQGQVSRFPTKLSETGLFAATAEHRLAKGVVPIAINAEAWADGATAERFIGVPGAGAVRVHARPREIPGSMFQRALDYPADTVVGKTFSVSSMDDKAAKRRVETQVLHYDGRDWRGYTYRWNAEQTDAELVPAEGAEAKLTLAGGKNGARSWRFSSRMECVRCHNPWSEHTLAFNVQQLNRPIAGGTENQITHLRQIGLIEDVGDKRPPEKLPKLANPHDESAGLNDRARSYLHVNCAHCHRNGGGGSAYVHLPFDIPQPDMKTVDAKPAQGTFGLREARVVAPGDPLRSVLYLRLAKAGSGHMPPLAAKQIDASGLALLHQWISKLPPPAGAKPIEPKLSAELEALKVARGAERARLLDRLLADPSAGLLLASEVREGRLAADVQKEILAAASAHKDVVVRDLFEPFTPEEERAARLGDSINAAELLKLTGDVARGQELFFSTGTTQCAACHRIAGKGTEIGPDLSAIGKKHDRARLLENLLEPSKTIEPVYTTWLAQTEAGQSISGLLVKKTDAAVTLKDAQGKQHELPAGEVEKLSPQRQSLMPDGLLKSLTAQQAADLLAYLESLK